MKKKEERKKAKKTVLLIDDSKYTLELVGSALEEKGIKVIAVSDVISANRAIHHEPVDLVLLDIMMPMLSGNEVCEIFKEMDAIKDIPVILFSEIGEERLKELVKESKADGYIPKAVGLQKTCAKVKEWLKKK